MNTTSVDTRKLAETFHKTPALVPLWTRCGKATCRCNYGRQHGPYWVLRWREGSVQHRRYVRQADVAHVEALIAERRAVDRTDRQHAAQAVTDLRRIRTLVRDVERKAAR